MIESGGAKTKKATTIKSHHNVGGLPETLGLKLLEPLRDLFKDEVRELGVALGLPHDMVYRHPFPGPGLGVRILGEVKRDYAELLRRADAIFIDELRNFKDAATGKSWYDLTSQAFAVFLPVKSVGVMGDGRTYDYVVALRAVQTSDFMTADWAELPYALLKKVSSRIINEVRGINRVTYDQGSRHEGGGRRGFREGGTVRLAAARGVTRGARGGRARRGGGGGGGGRAGGGVVVGGGAGGSWGAWGRGWGGALGARGVGGGGGGGGGGGWGRAARAGGPVTRDRRSTWTSAACWRPLRHDCVG